MKVLALMIALSLSGTTTSVYAQATGAQLNEICESKDQISRGNCFAYLRGISEGLKVGQFLLSRRQGICFPAGLTPEQIRLIVEKEIRDHPAELSDSAITVVTNSMIEAFSCKPEIAIESK
jgi:hypothetical protein